ncbi:MAG: hypothetical protein FJW40_22380 [Acidobacteria bacterium]|nr:hypothetical protein [Acidobacteriota bacterium]
MLLSKTFLPGLALWAAGTSYAAPVVLDFEQNKQAGHGYRFLPKVYEEDGYRLTTGTFFCHAQMPMSGVSDFWAGSTGMSTDQSSTDRRPDLRPVVH